MLFRFVEKIGRAKEAVQLRRFILTQYRNRKRASVHYATKMLSLAVTLLLL